MSRRIIAGGSLVLMLTFIAVGPGVVWGQSSVTEKAEANVWFAGHLINSRFSATSISET